MIYYYNGALFISTDKRKGVYADLEKNPHIAIVSYNSNTNKWIRIMGKVKEDSSNAVRDQMFDAYPNLRQVFLNGGAVYLVIYKLIIDKISLQ